MTELFFRHGEPFTGKAHIDEKGKPFIVKPHVCGRCGGAGGSDKWKFTGWTCFDCGGAGTRGTETHKLWTAEQLAKLNATAAKKAAKKADAAAAAKAARDAEVEARKAKFLEAHGELLTKAEAFAERNEFIADVVAKAHANANLTEGQEAALLKVIAMIEARDAQKAAAEWIGKVGERITLTVKAERVVTITTAFGAMHIVTMRTPEGNAVVAKGRFVPTTAHWVDDDKTGWTGWKVEPEPFTITATVKEHGEFRDEKQTLVQRVKEQAAEKAA